jgi:hypothetical protein
MQGIGNEAWADASSRIGAFTPEWKALSYLPMGTEVLWMGAALAVLAVALMATRMIEEF